ncbi:hypothetical protein GL503_20335 [Salmonella enterica]|uniref:Uncharacterized protein n=1 Tax=Salmonella enterica I TaxID=59201 RepID=A0A3R1BUK5_SALET|nr:hypothetical protein [Salmonella enterica]MML54691.1 hypothetical protein [Salmonella enterica subsp. enterica serovar Kidderminster]
MKTPPAVHFFRFFSPLWTFPQGRKSPRHGTSPPGRLKRDVVISAPGKSGSGEQAAEVGGRREAVNVSAVRRCALHPGSVTAGMLGAPGMFTGATGAAHPVTDAARPGFSAIRRSESPKPRLRRNKEGAALLRRRRGFSAHALAADDVDGGA